MDLDSEGAGTTVVLGAQMGGTHISSSWDESAPVTLPTPSGLTVLGGDPVLWAIAHPWRKEGKTPRPPFLTGRHIEERGFSRGNQILLKRHGNKGWVATNRAPFTPWAECGGAKTATGTGTGKHLHSTPVWEGDVR